MFEEAGYSLLGPLAMNIAAPDEGNMHLMEAVGTAEQKARWLCPLAAGEIRSCFCMTEPAPGAGSDPAALKTRAVQDGNHWVIDGEKWFITGADGAAFAIIMAAGDDGRATMFLADMNTPGIEVVRRMDSLDQGFPGGHCVVRFHALRVPASDILGEPGKGFRYAQVRLAPARLTHCMRWLGAARRAHAIAAEYARRREVFGRRLGEHEGVGFMLADNEMDIRMARLAIWHTAWVLDQGERGGTEFVDRESGLLRGDLARRRSLRADHGRPGRHRRNPRRAHLPRSARLPDLRWPVRGSPLVHRPQGDEGWRELVRRRPTAARDARARRIAAG